MDQVMWDYSASEPELDDNMVNRCSYCGRFCHKSVIDAKTGLCVQCKEKLHPNETEDADAEGGSSDSGTIASVRSKLDETDIVEQHAANSEPAVDTQLDEGNNGNPDSDTCARCWRKNATNILYNSPVCDRCFQVAQEKREDAKGTKKRYQPPTPHLQPGKKLTRVCDSCRQKRKRCQHRRVVDADDPEAHRRKRTKKEKAENTEKKGKKNEGKEGNAKEVKNAGTVEPGQDGTGSQSSMTEGHGDQVVAAISDQTETQDDGEVDDTDNDHDSNENLQRAIRESVELVYKREMLRLEAIAKSKVEEANKAVEEVKRHVKAWTKNMSKESQSMHA